MGIVTTMHTVCFNAPSGKTIENPSPEDVRDAILSAPKGFRGEISSGASIEITSGPREKESLLILPHDDLGFYLHYIHKQNGRSAEPWLSLWDASRLTEVVSCSDEWLASAGLFVPTDVAAAAAEEFVRTGQRSEAIKWIQPSEIPPEGNW